MKKWGIIGILLSLIFIAVGIFTLSDYGMTWDLSYRFLAGEKYLQFFVKRDLTVSQLMLPFEPSASYILSSILWWLFPTRSGNEFMILGFPSAMNNESWITIHSIIIPIFGGLAILIVYYFCARAYGHFAAIIAALSLFFFPSSSHSPTTILKTFQQQHSMHSPSGVFGKALLQEVGNGW